MSEVRKRIVTKVGFVYRTKKTGKGYRYLQLVAIDRANLNSDVIVVFNSIKQPESGRYDQLVESPIEFYTHTTVSQGVREGLWEKVGKAPVKVKYSRLIFKYYRDQEHIELAGSVVPLPFREPYWDIWGLYDANYRSVSDTIGQRLEAEEGDIFPASEVIARIENNKSINK